MSMIDIHLEALATVNEAHHVFLSRYKKHGKVVYGFVEGKEDPAFYRSAIERFLPDHWSVDLIVAGNKKKVLSSYRDIEWNDFPTRQIAFFVDRDLSEFIDIELLNASNIYITDGYSIENSFVSAEILTNLLLEIYGIADATVAEKSAIVEAFADDLLQFQDFMAPIMAQIIAWRREETKANLDNLHLPRMFEFKDGRLQIVAEFHDVGRRLTQLAACVGAECNPEDEIVKIESLFRSKDGCAKFTRGKYILWFFCNFISSIHRSIGLFVAAYSSPPKVKVSVGPANMMVVAAPRARVPKSLREFLEANYISHINGEAAGAE